MRCCRLPRGMKGCEWGASLRELVHGSICCNTSSTFICSSHLLIKYLLSRAFWFQHHRISELQKNMPHSTGVWTSLISFPSWHFLPWRNKVCNHPFLLLFFQGGYKMQDLRSTHKLCRLSHMSITAFNPYVILTLSQTDTSKKYQPLQRQK